MRRYFYLSIATILLGTCNIHAQRKPGDLHPQDSILFETNTIPFQIDTSQIQNCWQVGHPSKTFFNEAYSPPLAILTDTLVSYPVNNISSFTFHINDSLNPPCGGATFFQFMNKYETDTILDYGIVEYSLDNGISWQIARDTMIFPGGPYGPMIFYWQSDYSLTDGTSFPHPIHISGHSNGWVCSRFTWNWFSPIDQSPTFPFDSIIVRFTFKSDNIQTNKEGWMIDNIVIGCVELGSGVTTLITPSVSQVQICPNPLIIDSKATFSLFDKNSIFDIYNLLGQKLLSERPNAQGIVVFSRKSFQPGIYIWRAITANDNVETGKIIVE